MTSTTDVSVGHHVEHLDHVRVVDLGGQRRLPSGQAQRRRPGDPPKTLIATGAPSGAEPVPDHRAGPPVAIGASAV